MTSKTSQSTFSLQNSNLSSTKILILYQVTDLDRELNKTDALFICLRHLLQYNQLKLAVQFVFELRSRMTADCVYELGDDVSFLVAINQHAFTAWHDSNKDNFAVANNYRMVFPDLADVIEIFFNESLPFASFVRNVIVGHSARASIAEYIAIKSYIPSLPAASIVGMFHVWGEKKCVHLKAFVYFIYCLIITDNAEKALEVVDTLGELKLPFFDNINFIRYDDEGRFVVAEKFEKYFGYLH